MSIGSDVRKAITATIDALGSTITLTEYTDESSDGGYTADGESTSSSTSETAIPYDEIQGLVKEKFGNQETGVQQVALKYSASIAITGTKYKATWQEEVYDVTRIKPFYLTDALICYIITMSKRL